MLFISRNILVTVNAFITCNILLCGFGSGVKAANLGEVCDPTPSYSASWIYQDSCNNLYLYCEPTNRTCQYKGCSNSGYIRGWDIKVHPFPARCNTKTSYCPDDNSGCKSLLAIGVACEYQRDDECAGPYSTCLNSVCLVKGVPLEGRCGTEITNYTSYESMGQQVFQTIIRDNCTIGTYCDYQNTDLCINSKALGSVCDQDNECLSDNCDEGTHTCEVAADSFHQVANWAWGVVASVIFIFVFITLLFLWLLHRHQSKREHEKARRFFEQAKKFNVMAENEKLLRALATPGSSSSTSMIYLATPGSHIHGGNRRSLISQSASIEGEVVT